MIKKDLTGQKFGRLTVVNFSNRKIKNSHYTYYWKCLCNCGNYNTVSYKNLMQGGTKSCGCLKKENGSKHLITHDLSHTRFYTIYSMMKQRCDNKKHDAYNRYGGSGITYSWEKIEDFRNDMYESYLEHVKEFGELDTSLDRINNDKGYCKENCKWATRKEQSNNMRTNIKNKVVVHKEITYKIYDFLKKYNLSYTKYRSLKHSGLSIEEIINYERNYIDQRNHWKICIYDEFMDNNKLNQREEKILDFRFKDKMTLQGTANELELSRERIRQIEKLALEKLIK